MHKGFLKISCWVLGLLLLLGLLGYWGLVLLPQQKIIALEATLRAEGVPLTLADLEPDPVPEDENAAPLYLEAYRLLESISYEGYDIFYYKTDYGTDRFTEEHRLGFETLVTDPVFAQAMALIDQATPLPFCQFELDYGGEARNVLLPHVSPMLSLSSILTMKLKMQGDQGDFSEVDVILQRLNGLAIRLDQEPFLISKLVQIANIALYTDAIKYTLAAQAPNEKRLAMIDAQFARFSEEVIVNNWMQAERICMLDYWRSGDEHDLIWIDSFWNNSSGFVGTLTYLMSYLVPVWDELYYLEKMLDAEFVYTAPYHQIDWASEAIRIDEIPEPYIFSRDSLDMKRLVKQAPKGKALVDLAKVAVQLYRIRLEKGMFPDDLSGIEKLNLLDPFTHEPFKYAKTAEGFLLYSVGPNQVDDGGVKNPSADKDDISWGHPYEIRN